MIIARSILLFIVAALAEIGGAWLIWQGVREHRGLLFVGAGVIALGLYGFVATLQPDANFGRILAAYGGVFVAGSLAWGAVVDKFRPDRWDLIGAAICLAAKRIPSAVTLMSVVAGRPSGQLLFDHAAIVALEAVEELRSSVRSRAGPGRAARGDVHRAGAPTDLPGGVRTFVGQRHLSPVHVSTRWNPPASWPPDSAGRPSSSARRPGAELPSGASAFFTAARA